MTNASDEFKAQYQTKAYPAALLERYTVIECLSSSVNGETLLVTRHGENRYLVAKLMESAEANGEAALLGRLSHPGLPALIEDFTEGGTRVLVRSFVEGDTLDAVIAERGLSEAEVVGIGARLCNVLAYLHAQTPPIIHRDVKPQNVILGADGNVTLIDFGIARTYKPQAAKDTVFSGTSDFAPPEQYGFAQTDARADIYSLGVMLKFLLTRGDSEAEIVNRRLRNIIKKCTAFAPSARYRSAEAVKRALMRADGKRARRFAMVAVAVTAALIGLAVGRYALPYRDGAPSIAFREPTVERAVRQALDKPTGALTAEDLSRVYGLNFVGNESYLDYDSFIQAYDRAFAQDVPPVGLHTLSDFSLLPNLSTIRIAFGTYSDLDVLAFCPKMEFMQLFDNHTLTGLDGIASHAMIHYASFAGCDNIVNLSPLTSLPLLNCLDLTGASGVTDLSPLRETPALATLILSEGTRADVSVLPERIEIKWIK